MNATILHADVDAFFAAVEQRDNPSLRGRPTVVGVGVVMAASYEAKAHGIRGGMGGTRARRLCPELLAVPPRFTAYVEASRRIFDVFADTAPIVEGLSMEEAFLDVRGLEHISGTPEEIAERLRREVREKVGLTITVGVARTKVLAKMASRAAKPDGLLVVPPSEEQAFLLPIPVEAIWGVGEVTARKLHRRGIRTVADLAARTETELTEAVGPAAARQLQAIARNRDRRRVRSGRGRRSIGSQSAFGLRVEGFEGLEPRLAALVDRVTRRMRSKGRVGRTVILRLRFGDYKRASRSRTLVRATARTRTVLDAAKGLLAAARPAIERRGITMIGITISNLDSGGEGIQLELPIPPDHSALDAALDEIRERFGPDAVLRADAPGGRGAALLAEEEV